MSLGFGFALPAYPLRGGGGNNPFNQTGPTLDLSFVDGGTNVGNQLGADTYTLDTNFITPQYQVAAQYAVWVDGSGMTQRNFADIVTFTRGSNATQFDSTGSLVYAPVNLLLRSEALATSPWFNAGLTSIANNTLDVVDPAGGNTATKIVATGSGSAIGQTFAAISNAVTGSVWLRTVSGTLTFDLIIYLATSPFTVIGIQSVTATTTWQRFSVTSSVPPASAQYNFQLQLIPAGTLYAWGGQVNATPVLGGITSSLTTYYPTTTTAYYGPRFDYNPSTLAAQGLLIEEQRTNSIRNNTMQGAVAGTPGTPPTNWSFSTGGATTVQLMGTGTENGITYVDYRFQGTGAADTWNLIYDSLIVAANGQTWTGSIYLKLVGGSTANLPFIQRLVFRDSGFANIQSIDSSALTPTGAGLATQRNTISLTATQATTAFVTLQLNGGTPTGAYNITLRIGLPQLEQGAFATSVIPTTTTALTRSADVASVNTLSPWYNQTEGTVYAELQSLSPLTAAQSVALNKYPNVWCINAGTSDSSVIWYGVGAEMFISGTYNNIGTVPSGVNKFAVALAASGNQSSSSLNGAAAVNRSGSLSVTATQFTLGRDPGGTQVLNGYLRRIVYYPRRLPNADLQTITA